jgi:hypothetical protein
MLVATFAGESSFHEQDARGHCFLGPPRIAWPQLPRPGLDGQTGPRDFT